MGGRHRRKRRLDKGGVKLEYLYCTMILLESGKEINTTNIQKILKSLDKEVETTKIQNYISALSVILSAKNVNIEMDAIDKENIYEQFIKLQKRFDYIENSIISMNEKLENIVLMPSSINLIKEKDENIPPIANTLLAQAKNFHNKTEPSETVMEAEPLGSPLNIEDICDIPHDQPCRYVYGIAGKGKQINMGNIGLNGSNVYTIPYKDSCIIVHDCQAEPYESEDENVVKDWLFTQQEVLDNAAEIFNSVLPMSFDMIIEGTSENNAEEAATNWLANNYESFIKTLSKIENCQEYGIQIILNTGQLSENIFEIDEKLRKKKEEIDAKPEGIAYMEKEILKDLIKERIEEKADLYFKEFYARIKKYPEDIIIGKVKKIGGNQQMLMNLSCLVKKDRLASLGEELEKIQTHEAITVRFSGPWAPYSFVTPEKGVTSNVNE